MDKKRTISEYLAHYGMPRRSGRYPWGSGDNPYQHEGDFLSRVDEYKSQGLSEKEIAKLMGMSTTQFRVQKSLSRSERRSLEVERAKDLRAKGYSYNEIAEIMGYNSDSSVRSLLNSVSEERMMKAMSTAEFLKEQIDKKGMIDVGVGVEKELGVSKERLREALAILEAQGYPVYGGRIPQLTNEGRRTTLKVVCPPGTEHKEIFDLENVHSLEDYRSHDGGETFKSTFVYPESMNSNRLQVRYAEEGGIDKDGIIEIRRGVADLSLGESHYAQVRILVDNDHYLKGMAVYADDLPDGVDVRFNTNKSSSVSKMDVLKKIKDDPDNPFGALIKEDGGQSYYLDENGNEHLSLINKTRVEGDWGEWADRLPSQFLAKQNVNLIKKQLNLAEADKQAEFDEIDSLTNPTVKKLLLEKFADECDSQAEHLYAAALPRQQYQVILPLTTIGDKEIYAPNYENGEQVALIRFPHGGTFEIPILTVNNKNKEGQASYGVNALDAVGISKNVADRLSGADFDGDTVMVIPVNNKIKITSTHPLKGLEGFDPKLEYGYSEIKVDSNGTEHYYREGTEFKPMKNTQTEMGKISNLITDMTIRGATEDELARAVRHSMVVIDAEKHGYDYKQSEADNGITALKKKYQSHEDGTYGGASTLISLAKSETRIPKTQGSPRIDPETGEVSYKVADDLYYVDKKGNTQMRTQVTTKMRETKDARDLSSGTLVEDIYADYANSLKALANTARKTMVNTGKIQYNPSAKETYKEEVKRLDAALDLALANKSKEREAQRIANVEVSAKKQSNPGMKKKEIQKIAQQALTKARNLVGAKRKDVEIVLTDREWDAIQAGAITENKLWQILNNTNIDSIRERATPKTTTGLSSAKVNLISSLKASGHTNAEIANRLGITASSVQYYLKGGN